MSENQKPPEGKNQNEQGKAITLDSFIATLDTENPFLEEFIEELKAQSDIDEVVFERKSKNMLNVIKNLIAQGKFPHVDKKSGIVFGLPTGFHELLRGLLQQYYVRQSGSSYKSAEDYMNTGKGWYISAMEPDTIIVGAHYRPDRHDDQVFPFFKIRQVSY